MAQESILVVEDEKDLLELVRYNLAKEDFQVTGALSGEEALNKINAQLPDLVVLDLMLPGLKGLEVCRLFKKDPKTCHIPIVILTAKGEEEDIVAGLEMGADDYIVKPFSPRILVARVKAVLRRNTSNTVDETTSVKIHDLVIHPSRHKVLVQDTPVELTFTEFRILHALILNVGKVMTRYQLVDAVRGEDYAVTDRAVDVHIVSLRKKLGSAGGHIETVRGVGYRLEEE